MPDNHDPQEPRPEIEPEQDGRLTPESYDDPYAQDDHLAQDTLPAPAEPAAVVPAPAPPPPPADTSSKTAEEDDNEENGMLRMSFLEHLEELT